MNASTLSKFSLVSIIFGSTVFAAETPVTTPSIRPLTAQQLEALKTDTIQNGKDSLSSLNTIEASVQGGYANGGGYGGNERRGLLLYDGLPYHPEALTIRRDDKNSTCYLENQHASVYHYNFWGSLKLDSYKCKSIDPNHNGVYWNEEIDNHNGGYSTGNDALYASIITNRMYEEWFGFPITLNAAGFVTPFKFLTHQSKLGNAYIDENGVILLGDGDENYYPFTSPGLVAFMMAYKFTAVQSNLDWTQPQAGAISVAFSAMTEQALKFYMTGRNDWKIADEVSKNGLPMYYMDWPSKDCYSRSAPGNECSIDHITQYNRSLAAHYGSGIYRRAFYLLATTPGWDVKKAYTVMVQANRFYWTKSLSFSQGVCGLVSAAHDLRYDESAILDAFSQVGLHPGDC